MSVRSWIGGAALCTALLGGCAGEQIREAPIYVVQPQDTLYSIAWRHNLDYRDLARWNHIGPDFRITVGERLALEPPRAVPVAPAATAPAAAATARPAAAIPQLTWVWPTEHSAAPRSMPSGGILFPGRLGQQVRAAAAGRVVYTGSGIRGYGQLVIIKHNDVLLSAYAYNRDVIVREGQVLNAGELIAHMGSGAQQNAALYFEIRHNGKPIDPLPFLSGKISGKK